MSAIAANLQAVRARIATAEREAGRAPGSVTLLAVSKTWGGNVIREALQAGQAAFGESYAQELQQKAASISDPSPEWHFIGPLQGNKTRLVAQHCKWVHSVEREKIARRLAEQRDALLPPLQVCIQVNVSGEASKSGVAPEATLALARTVAGLPGLCLRGLMCIPEPTDDVALQRQRFAALRVLRDEVAQGLGVQLDTLSMGMSDDLEAAVQEGATIVRVGSAIFGTRHTA